jgi:DNA-binding PadR family transcriptional regulator
VRRSLVYRSLEQLKAHGFVREGGAQSGARGPARTRVKSTAAGRRALEAWLRAPVSHVRDFRDELLLKLALLHRRGESTVPLLEAQLAQLQPILDGLAAGRRGTAGVERLVFDWRAENARAAARFVKRLLRQPG